MLDSVIDRFQPTKERPEPDLDSAGDRGLLFSRGGAALIDLSICYFLLEAPALYVINVLFASRIEALGLAAIGLSLAVLAPLYITYSFGFEWLYGRTPGKVNRGLLVVAADGGEPGRRASAVRNFLRYVDLLGVPPLVIGAVVALFADGRRVGDILADTRVVRIRAEPETGTAVDAVEEPEAARKS
jgi:uncharacterized RDD family membrane protein YckC